MSHADGPDDGIDVLDVISGVVVFNDGRRLFGTSYDDNAQNNQQIR